MMMMMMVMMMWWWSMDGLSVSDLATGIAANLEGKARRQSDGHNLLIDDDDDDGGWNFSVPPLSRWSRVAQP